MMIATVLLIVVFLIWLVKDYVLFSFWHFLWIYPAEILFYIILAIIEVFTNGKN